ncbi:MAG: hypothetical protein WD314_06215 [Trueperaceae bacterium]
MNNVQLNFFRAASLLLVLALLSVASADGNGYNSDNDVYLQVENEAAERAASRIGVGRLGGTAFGVQEGAHELVGDSSGQTVEHYYIWFCIGSECVPIDPFEFGG